MPEIVAGYLDVGRDQAHQVIVNHSALQSDANGNGHIVFSVSQARAFARLMLTQAAYAVREAMHPKAGLLPDIKIFAMTDCEWYAAASAEDALKCMAKLLGYERTAEGIAEMRETYDGGVEPVELDADSIDRSKYVEVDVDGVRERMTFRERLNEMIADGAEFPCFFASTEF